MNLTKIIDFVKGIFLENGKPSPKRISTFAVVSMLAYVVIRYTEVTNSVEMALTLSGLIASLVGVTAFSGKKNTPSSDEVN